MLKKVALTPAKESVTICALLGFMRMINATGPYAEPGPGFVGNEIMEAEKSEYSIEVDYGKHP